MGFSRLFIFPTHLFFTKIPKVMLTGPFWIFTPSVQCCFRRFWQKVFLQGGAISFGEFEVDLDTTGRHQLYFGKALIEAYRAEQAEKWIGITVLPSAWMPYEQNNPGSIVSWEREGTWLKRGDNVLLLNPFIKLRGWYDLFLAGEVPTPYSLYDEPEFPNDILAFKFIRDQAKTYAAKNDFMSPAAVKYHMTLNFLKKILGDKIYRWGEEASQLENF